MAKIVIFGASGFVGRVLTPMLRAQGVEVATPSSTQLNLADEAAPEAVAELVQDGDSLVFLSAYTPEKGDAASLSLKNITMAAQVLAGIKNRALHRVIYVSSDAVYPMTADTVSEQTPPCPQDLYGHMHAMREQYFKTVIPAEKLAILRPCAIYGAGDTHNSYGINRFVRTALAQGEITLFGGGEEYRDHIHVEDVAKLIVAVYMQNVAGTFNLASGEAWRFKAIAEYIQARMGKDVRIIHKPRAVPITHRHFNTAKLLRAFPNQLPRRIDEGITAFLDVMKASV